MSLSRDLQRKKLKQQHRKFCEGWKEARQIELKKVGHGDNMVSRMLTQSRRPTLPEFTRLIEERQRKLSSSTEDDVPDLSWEE